LGWALSIDTLRHKHSRTVDFVRADRDEIDDQLRRHGFQVTNQPYELYRRVVENKDKSEPPCLETVLYAGLERLRIERSILILCLDNLGDQLMSKPLQVAPENFSLEQSRIGALQEGCIGQDLGDYCPASLGVARQLHFDQDYSTGWLDRDDVGVPASNWHFVTENH
jgi:hypothetical protein